VSDDRRERPSPRPNDSAGEIGLLAGDVAKLRQEVASDVAKLRGELAALAPLRGEVAALRESMRPKLDTLNDEITSVGEKGVRIGKLAHRLLTEKRGGERLRRKLFFAVVIGFLSAIGAGGGALALRACARPVAAHVGGTP
jgi:hypothetical protein